MDWLNYHHLYYFWTVAREGSVTRASERLMLAQPTVSGQLRALEKALGEPLFDRAGRRLVLTEAGRVAFRYADDIFSLGRELTETLRGRPHGRPVRLVVGVADQLPKMVSRRLLEPAFRLPDPLRVVIREGRPERLLADLAVHELDVVLSDAPVGPGMNVRVFSHLLGESAVSVVGTARLAARYRRGFPAVLNGAPFLLPPEPTTLRMSLDQWFERAGVRPAVVAECDDSALLKALGQGGLGLFAIPSVVETEVCRQYEVRPVGRADGVRERFYAMTVDRKLKHPAVLAISEAARQELFG